jgi:hypothetical protein
MQFFVDVEFTGSHTSAYDKYEAPAGHASLIAILI